MSRWGQPNSALTPLQRIKRKGGDFATRLSELENAIQYESQRPRPYNKIINGNFRVPQRGTSFAAIANNAYSLDRWKYGKSGTMVHTVSQSSDVPTDRNGFSQAAFSLLIDCTTADAAIAAGDFAIKFQRIEGYNFKSLVGQRAPLLFWVKATKIGIYCAAFRNSGADRSFVVEYEVEKTNAWELKSITIPFDFSGGTWNYTNGVGLDVIFTLAAGTTFQTAPNAWQAGNFFATANQVNACDSTDNNFLIALVDLKEGPESYGFEHRSIEEELASCKRFFEIQANNITNENIAMGMALTASTASFVLMYAEKRAAPIITLNAIGNFAVVTRATSTNPTGYTASQETVERAFLNTSGITVTQGDALALRRRAGNNAELYINAEL